MDVLDLNKKILKILAIWPENDHISMKSLKWTLLFVLSTMSTVLPVLYGSLRQVIYGITDIAVVIDGIVAVIDYLFYVYVVICFLLNFAKIKAAIASVTEFKKFCTVEVIARAENEVRKYTKGVLLYAIVGLCFNSALPLLNKRHCPARQTQIMQERDPCGLIIRAYFPLDVSSSPYFELAYLSQAYCTIVVAIAVLSITLCLLGLLIHLMAQIKNCKNLVLEIFNSDYEDTEESRMALSARMNFCVEYHIEIVQFSLRVVSAFSSMMLIHLTMTSIAISALGYQIITGVGSHESVRFVMHLGGWLILLFFTCYYGQKLIDESSGLAVAAYNSKWYTGSIPVQKSLVLLIMRAQRPLMLSAASLGVMSYETFLQVLKSAYSYLTLLLTMTK